MHAQLRTKQNNINIDCRIRTKVILYMKMLSGITTYIHYLKYTEKYVGETANCHEQ